MSHAIDYIKSRGLYESYQQYLESLNGSHYEKYKEGIRERYRVKKIIETADEYRYVYSAMISCGFKYTHCKFLKKVGLYRINITRGGVSVDIFAPNLKDLCDPVYIEKYYIDQVSRQETPSTQL